MSDDTKLQKVDWADCGKSLAGIERLEYSPGSLQGIENLSPSQPPTADKPAESAPAPTEKK